MLRVFEKHVYNFLDLATGNKRRACARHTDCFVLLSTSLSVCIVLVMWNRGFFSKATSLFSNNTF